MSIVVECMVVVEWLIDAVSEEKKGSFEFDGITQSSNFLKDKQIA